MNANLLIGISHQYGAAASREVPLGTYDRRELEKKWDTMVGPLMDTTEVEHFLLVVVDGGTGNPSVYDDWGTGD